MPPQLHRLPRWVASARPQAVSPGDIGCSQNGISVARSSTALLAVTAAILVEAVLTPLGIAVWIGCFLPLCLAARWDATCGH